MTLSPDKRIKTKYIKVNLFMNCLLHTGSKDDSTYIVQTLDFHLGHNTMVTKPCGALESPMATITKITRRRHENPPHGVATVKEWFNYVTAMRNEGKHFSKIVSFMRAHLFSGKPPRWAVDARLFGIERLVRVFKNNYFFIFFLVLELSNQSQRGLMGDLK